MEGNNHPSNFFKILYLNYMVLKEGMEDNLSSNPFDFDFPPLPSRTSAVDEISLWSMSRK
jgi:hypothetical protein